MVVEGLGFDITWVWVWNLGSEPLCHLGQISEVLWASLSSSVKCTWSSLGSVSAWVGEDEGLSECWPLLRGLVAAASHWRISLTMCGKMVYEMALTMILRKLQLTRVLLANHKASWVCTKHGPVDMHLECKDPGCHSHFHWLSLIHPKPVVSSPQSS